MAGPTIIAPIEDRLVLAGSGFSINLTTVFDAGDFGPLVFVPLGTWPAWLRVVGSNLVASPPAATAAGEGRYTVRATDTQADSTDLAFVIEIARETPREVRPAAIWPRALRTLLASPGRIWGRPNA